MANTESFSETVRVLQALLAELLQKTEPADSQNVTIAPATAVALSNVNSSASNVTLLSPASRRGGIVFNDSTAALNVKFGATASASSFTYRMLPGATLEFPSPIYQGIVDGIWDSANGAARIGEVT